jgi:hypothetical protein
MKAITIGSKNNSGDKSLELLIFKEARDLISRIVVSSDRATRLEGTYVVVMVVPQFLDDLYQAFELEVSCYPVSRATMSWTPINLIAISSETAPGADTRLVSLSRTGTAVLGPFRRGFEYRLVACMEEELLESALRALQNLLITAGMDSSSGVDFVKISVASERTNLLELKMTGVPSRYKDGFPWSSVGVILEAGSDELFGPKWFDTSGRLSFTLERQAGNILSILTEVESTRVVVGMSAGRGHGAGLPQEQGHAASVDAGEKDESPVQRFPCSYLGDDSRIAISAWRDRGGEVIVHAETRATELKNAVISIDFCSADGMVITSAIVRLRYRKVEADGQSIYWAEWNGNIPRDINSIRVTRFETGKK